LELARKLRGILPGIGGVHPPSQKIAADMSITPGPQPAEVFIPLSQHLGTPCEPLVAKQDRVMVGTRIGDSEGFVSAPVHSSVSGEVTGIVMHPHPTGEDSLAVVIKSDRLDTLDPAVKPHGNPDELTPEEIRRLVREGGIVGMGGAGFPTHVKLSPPADKPIELVIINGAECEPYLTGDYRLMLERGEDVVKGARLIQRAVGAERVVVAIEETSPQAINAMREAGGPLGIEVVSLPARYPQGAEKTLVDTITGKQVPHGKLPMEVGAIVDNVGTAAAIYDAVYMGMPLVERTLTVAGDGVARHANLKVKIGTLVEDVIDHCGGLVGGRGKVIVGGPMMGIAQYTMEVPVTKTTSGITVLSRETMMKEEPGSFTCIRCGRCVKNCPMNLMPYLIGAYADKGMWDKLEDLNIEDCMECGCCAYGCPTRNPLVQLCKVGKEGFVRKRSKMEALERAGKED